MAKINHNNYLDVVDSVWSAAKERGIMHVNSQESSFDGTKFRINGSELINFGTCGYLGLETHPDLIAGSIALTKKFGTQLSMSRAYIRPIYIQELEELLSAIFNGHKVICYTSTSNAHISVIATIIKPDDLIILDQQVHFSVQFPCKNTKLQGTGVKMVRHSNYEMLDEMIREEANNYNRIWYMADGVYSMHGDLPDTDKLKALMDKHPKLHLYFDDAHGMGWSGKNGAGYIFDRLGASDRVVIISTLAKGFGCVGGTAIFANPEMYRKVDIFGGPLSYSHPLSPANVGAAIASAKLHLSNDIYQYQDELRELIDHMNRRLLEKNLPNISSPHSPIYFIGSGMNKVTRNFVHRILQEGLYVNTATFPVVPNDKSGLRFTLTRHNTKADIDALADAMAYHLPLAIQEENDTIERVYQDFGFSCLVDLRREKSGGVSLIVERYTTIDDIDQETWDRAFKDRGNISHAGMRCMEEIFSGNEKPEDNWSFHYIMIKDRQGRLVLVTFFTGAIYKDDMLSLENVSKKIEEVRKTDPYFLCSKTLAMGTLFSEGDYICADLEHPEFRQSIEILFSFVASTKQEIGAKVVIFRDFEEMSFMHKVLDDEGYAKIRMPNSFRLRNPKWNSYDELLALISSPKKRKNIRREALKFEPSFDVSIKIDLTPEEAELYYELFLNIKRVNFAFNFFSFPRKIVAVLARHAGWEFIELKLKGQDRAVGCAWCYVGERHYSPIVVGLDYKYLDSHCLYKQVIFQIVKRANELDKETVYFGFSAEYEKTKYMAVPIPTYAYMKVDDTYNFEFMESLSNIDENTRSAK